MKCVVYAFLISLIRSSAVDGVESRQLLVYSQVTGESYFPFVMSLMRCSSEAPVTTTSCIRICTGSLISPNVILTSAFCVSTELNSDDLSPSEIYAKVGQNDLAKVSAIRNSGFGENARFGFDNDIALLVLEKCLSVGSDGPSPIRVATAGNDVAPCDTVHILSSGQSSILPISLRPTDESLRIMPSIVHPSAVCKSEFANLALGDVAVSSIAPVDAAKLNATMISDLFICSGGESPASICFGDAGSPVVNSGPDILVGIASVLPSGTCGLGPDYATRLAFHAKWISTQLSTIAICSGWSVSKSFASWPVPDWKLSPEYTSTRCGATQWQCVKDGVCIHDWQRCDGTKNCNDGSDEDNCDDSPRRLAQCVAVETACVGQLLAAQKAVYEVKAAAETDVPAAVKMLAQACSTLTTCAEADLASCSLSSAVAPIAIQCKDAANFVSANQRNIDYSDSFNFRNKIICRDSHSNAGADGTSDAASQLTRLQSIFAIIIILAA